MFSDLRPLHLPLDPIWLPTTLARGGGGGVGTGAGRGDVGGGSDDCFSVGRGGEQSVVERGCSVAVSGGSELTA